MSELSNRISYLEGICKALNVHTLSSKLLEVEKIIESFKSKERELNTLIHLLNKNIKLNNITSTEKMLHNEEDIVHDGKCIDCKTEGPVHYHHIVPKSRGGTVEVPLCERCHGLVHHDNTEKFLNNSFLIREGLQRAKQAGTILGRPKIVNQELVDTVVSLRMEGKSIRNIVTYMQYKISKTSIERIIRENKNRINTK